jgi:hypothetical protein
MMKEGKGSVVGLRNREPLKVSSNPSLNYFAAAYTEGTVPSRRGVVDQLINSIHFRVEAFNCGEHSGSSLPCRHHFAAARAHGAVSDMTRSRADSRSRGICSCSARNIGDGTLL